VYVELANQNTAMSFSGESLWRCVIDGNDLPDGIYELKVTAVTDGDERYRVPFDLRSGTFRNAR